MARPSSLRPPLARIQGWTAALRASNRVQRGADCHSAAVSAAVSQQFRSSSAAVPQQLRSSSAAAPQSFRVTSAVAPCCLRSRPVLPPQSSRVTSAVSPHFTSAVPPHFTTGVAKCHVNKARGETPPHTQHATPAGHQQHQHRHCSTSFTFSGRRRG